jgi:hypothetical protein
MYWGQDENFRSFLVWACLPSCCYHTMAQLWCLCPVKCSATAFTKIWADIWLNIAQAFGGPYSSKAHRFGLCWWPNFTALSKVNYNKYEGDEMCNMFGIFVELFSLLLQLISNPKQFFMNRLIREFFLWNVFISLCVHTRERKGGERGRGRLLVYNMIMWWRGRKSSADFSS